jgi:hypothetical protein
VQRLRLLSPAAPRAACLLLAAGLAVAAGIVMAQTAQTGLRYPDLLAPRLETNANKPPRFSKSSPASNTEWGAPTTFALPPSGAGTTGFDATNAPDRPTTVRPRSGTTANAQANAQNSQNGEMSALRVTQAAQMPPTPPSPYQLPQIVEPAPANATANTATNALAAAPPGAPPVPAVGPIRKPLPKRRARSEEDPYAPLGIRVGAFNVYPSLELIGGYDTNPGQSPDGKAAWLYTAQPELRMQSDWSRHSLKADLRGSYTGYSPDQEPTLSRPYFNGTVDGRIDVSHRTRIDLQGRGLISTDNPGNPNLQAGLAKLPIYFVYGGYAGIGHRFNRLDLSVKGDAQRTEYQNSTLTDGSIVSNKDQNYDQYTGTFRAGYQVTPDVIPFAEASVDTRKHDLNADASGYQRDSNSITGKGGMTFKMRGSLAGEVALGYTKRSYEDPRLVPVQGLIGNASLVWNASALTTVKLSGASTVGESTIAGTSGVLYRDVGLQVDHAFRRWLIGTVKLGYGNDDYVGLSRDDNRFSAGVGLTYKFNRWLQLKGEIDQYWLRSNQSGNNYNETLFLLGLKLQR